MKIITIAANYNNSTYKIHKTLGLLLEYNLPDYANHILPEKINNSFEQVLYPYKLKPNYKKNSQYRKSNNSISAKFLAKLITFLCIKSFVFVRLISVFRYTIFETTEEAIIYYRKLFPGIQQKLCLPRSLFAACTSKTFKKDGAIFIGVFLPSRAMHAWIIEKHYQPDPYDDIWICYQPVAIMYNN